jgi:hypothetical protein
MHPAYEDANIIIRTPNPVFQVEPLTPNIDEKKTALPKCKITATKEMAIINL